MSMQRYICIHGHFYQPPRENPWLELVESQDSAHPYHDWNERITAECYATNARARILDDQGRIAEIFNNYARMSFNFGPTLLAWLERHSPGVYAAVLEADRVSRKLFGGHGSALAQVYNHMILPLANPQDKLTQVRWGMRDFEHRFGRRPEGMWLPETAVDLETLEVMAGEGIAFTVLAPRQASHIRAPQAEAWHEIRGEKIDPSMPYRLNLPSGRSIALFFYDAHIARAVAFEKLLASGEAFVGRLRSAFVEGRPWPQIVHIATDGESYGHHHRFGDMALAYALNAIDAQGPETLTNYGAYLAKHPPTYEVRIIEDTSWSCVHGLERWRSDCGCCTGGHPQWRQAWRGPLREALDWLRDALIPAYEREAARLLRDPWAARNDYIEVILDRSRERVEGFLPRHLNGGRPQEEKTAVLKLLEMQRYAMLMYTSCGWFFDDLSGIETIQILQYAGRVIQLAREVFALDLESPFLERLGRAKSNIEEQGDGRDLYERHVRPTVVDLKKACAYYAANSLFNSRSERKAICCYRADREDYHALTAGSARLVIGRARLTSEVTWESGRLAFGILHFGDHNISCGVRDLQAETQYRDLLREVSGAFEKADFPETLRFMDKHFGSRAYSLKSLYRDEQRRILGLILRTTLQDIESEYRRLYEKHIPIMLFLRDSDTPPPRILSMAAELVINADLRLALGEEDLDLERIEGLLERAKSLGITLEKETLAYRFRKSLEGLARRLAGDPEQPRLLAGLTSALDLVGRLPFAVDLWELQNICYDMGRTRYPDFRHRAAQGSEAARSWVASFDALSRSLRVRLDRP